MAVSTYQNIIASYAITISSRPGDDCAGSSIRCPLSGRTDDNLPLGRAPNDDPILHTRDTSQVVLHAVMTDSRYRARINSSRQCRNVLRDGC